MNCSNGRLYWTRTSDLSHVKGTRYQLRQETIEDIRDVYNLNTNVWSVKINSFYLQYQARNTCYLPSRIGLFKSRTS